MLRQQAYVNNDIMQTRSLSLRHRVVLSYTVARINRLNHGLGLQDSSFVITCARSTKRSLFFALGKVA